MKGVDKSPMTPDEGTTERKEYLDERKVLLEGRSNAVRSLEKTIVTLAAGGLALSITFLHDIAPHPHQTGWIIASWTLLFLSLLFMLTVFMLGVYAYDKDIASLAAEKAGEEENRPLGLILVLQILEWSALGLFILGGVFFAIFALVNLPK